MRSERGGGDGRDMRAFVVLVPIVALLWMAASLAIAAVVDGPVAALRDFPAVLLGGIFVGLPMAAAVVVVAGALFALLEASVGVGRRSAWLAGCLLGVAVGGLLAFWLQAPLALETVRGGVLGLLASEIWWRLRGVAGD